jgi:hypothetical protein
VLGTANLDNFDPKVLMSIIQKRVQCPILVNLIRNGLKAKVFEDKQVQTHKPNIEKKIKLKICPPI